MLLAQGQLVAAESLLLGSRDRWKRSGAPEWRAARSASALGEAFYRQGRIAEAEKYLVEGYRGLVASTSADPDTKAKARERIARFYTDRGQRHKLDELSFATAR